MISIRLNEEVLTSVMKLIKRHFTRQIRTHYEEEVYNSCKNDVDTMYKKISEAIYKKIGWSKDFTVFSKANYLIEDLNHIKGIYESFVQYNKTPNNLIKYKVEITLSILMAKKLDSFLEKEIAFQILAKKTFKELNNVIDFQKNLQSSIDSFEDKSISVSIKAEEFKSWELAIEEFYPNKVEKEAVNNNNNNNNNNSNKDNDIDFENNMSSEAHFSDESELFKLGYKITGLSRLQRWNILKNKAIPILGLDRTVQIISSLIDMRKLQQHGEVKYANAINEWNYDLSRLADFY